MTERRSKARLADVPRLARDSPDPFWRDQADYLFVEFGHEWGPDEEAIAIAQCYLAEQNE